MLGTKEELTRSGFRKMYVYLQLAAKLCCSILHYRVRTVVGSL